MKPKRRGEADLRTMESWDHSLGRQFQPELTRTLGALVSVTRRNYPDEFWSDWKDREDEVDLEYRIGDWLLDAAHQLFLAPKKVPIAKQNTLPGFDEEESVVRTRVRRIEEAARDIRFLNQSDGLSWGYVFDRRLSPPLGPPIRLAIKSGTLNEMPDQRLFMYLPDILAAYARSVVPWIDNPFNAKFGNRDRAAKKYQILKFVRGNGKRYYFRLVSEFLHAFARHKQINWKEGGLDKLGEEALRKFTQNLRRASLW